MKNSTKSSTALATSSIKSPSPKSKELVSKLGGMPEQKTAEAIMKANYPSSRKAAPDSFRPASNCK